MKKLFLSLVAMFFAFTVVGQPPIIEGDLGYYFRYNPTTNTTTLRVVGNPSTIEGAITIPETVTYNGITYTVTEIEPHGFNTCEGLTSITIPSTVTKIGTEAFCGTNLTSVVCLAENAPDVDALLGD